jgi:hypothetical protein
MKKQLLYHLINDHPIAEILRFGQEEDPVDLEDYLVLLSLR